VKSQAKYGRPPVIEVVSGLVFEPIRSLTVAHYGLYWHRIVDEFPESKHALPVGLEDGTPPGEPFFLPRLWLIHKGQDALVQLQSNRFYFNWREGPNRSPYTSYVDIYAKFMEHWKGFVQFLADRKMPAPRVLQCELTYVNHIPPTAGWSSMTDIGKVLAPLSWGKGSTGFLPPPKTVNWNASFELPEGKGNMTVRMQPALRGQDKKELVLSLELAAVGPPADASDKALDSWFGTAHEWIVRGFEDVTDKGVQRSVWGKK